LQIEGEEDDDPYTRRRLSMGPAGSSGAAATPQTDAATAEAHATPSAFYTPQFAASTSAPAATPLLSPRGGGAAAAAHAPFATAETVGDCLAFLQTSLEPLGVKTWLPDAAAAAADPPAALAAALSAAYELLRLLQRAADQRERQEELLSRLRVEARTADRAAQRIQGQSEHQGQEAAGLKIKVRGVGLDYSRLAGQDLLRRSAAACRPRGAAEQGLRM
jgi:hypothetical protein